MPSTSTSSQSKPSFRWEVSVSHEGRRTGYLVTASIDGHVKLWKKQEQGIEFVKQYRAHLSTVVGISASSDGQLFASVAEDGTAKVFDILNYGEYHCHDHPLSVLTAHAHCRYDQHDKTWFYAPRLLLGAQTRDRSRNSRSVCNLHYILLLSSS